MGFTYNELYNMVKTLKVEKSAMAETIASLLQELETLETTVVKKVETTNITTMTDTQINSLKCGDMVIKITGTQKHSYRVSYKEDGIGICLTYSDASLVETVSYDYTDNHWVYNSTDSTPLTE